MNITLTYIGHAEAVKVLLKHGAFVNVVNLQRFTPLHLAAKHGSAEVIKVLINNGADVSAENVFLKNPHFYARENGRNVFFIMSRVAVFAFVIDFLYSNRKETEMQSSC